MALAFKRLPQDALLLGVPGAQPNNYLKFLRFKGETAVNRNNEYKYFGVDFKVDGGGHNQVAKVFNARSAL